MKKLLIALCILALASPAIAAWTTSTTFVATYEYKNDQQLLLYKITATSDASGSGDIKLSTALQTTYGSENGIENWQKMQGGMLFAIEFVPGAATPTSQGTITIDTADGTLIFSEQVAVAGTGEVFAGDVDSSLFVPLTDLIFACSTLANEKTATFYIWILR